MPAGVISEIVTVTLPATRFVAEADPFAVNLSEPLADAASAAALGPAASGGRAGRPYPLHGAGGGYGRAAHHAGHLAHRAGWAADAD